MKKLSIFLLSLLVLTACHKEQKQTGPNEAEMRRADSLALHVAVYPSECCLPLYLAKEVGIFDSLGVDVRLQYLSTMEDCDTALIHHRAEVTASDIARIICMRKDGFRATSLASIPGSLSLYTAPSKRLKEIAQLKERLVGMDRHSESDYWSDKMLAGTKVERLEVFRTQFNRHYLRQDMLGQGLIDAAFLDEPFASNTQAKGAKKIWSRDDNENQAWTLLACPTTLLKDERRMQQVNTLLKCYKSAVDKLNNDTTLHSVVGDILFHHFGFEKAEAEQLVKTHFTTFHHVEAVRNETVDKALNWLIERGWISKRLSTDSINSPIK